MSKWCRSLALCVVVLSLIVAGCSSYPQVKDEGNVQHVASAIALYPVNRVVDFLDVLNFNFGFGFGVHGNLHATRVLQLGAGGAATSKLGLNGRELGVYNEARAELSAGPLSLEKFKQTSAFSTIKEFDTATERPLLYRIKRDYLGFGADLTLAIVSLGLEAKPVEAVDLLLGVFAVDFKYDDWRATGLGKTYFTPKEQATVSKMVVVSSRVAKSPYYCATVPEGIDVFAHRGTASFFGGRLGSVLLAGKDKREREGLNQALAGFTVEDEVAQRVYDELAGKLEASAKAEFASGTKFALVSPKEVLAADFEKTKMKLGREVVVRYPNYEAIVDRFQADAILDLRVREWAVYDAQLLGKARTRLVVEAKIVKFPENRAYLDIEHEYYELRHRGHKLDEFKKNDAALVKEETMEAIRSLVVALAGRMDLDI